ATEALQIVQLGLDLRPGDEVISTSEDYWAMWNTWQQRVRRDGITYSEIKFSPPYPAPEEIVARFENAITSRTKILLFCHITWLTGHILPVRDICVMARSKGVRTIVDGAHAVSHIPFRVRDLECDYYGASGHKWLQAPLGTGFLYVRREHIGDLWPLTPAWEKVRTDIRKFEWVGSRAPAGHNAIADALDFQERLGVERKAARLHYLTRRWAERLGPHASVRIFTDLNPARSCGIGALAVEGIDHQRLARHLLERYRILVLAFGKDEYDGPPGIRVAPNVYTSVREIDRFTEAMEAVLQTGLPGSQ
ncbi:MAG: aminotransferase class V-fold PLP-dependent enzyme, partial [Candidatus Methylomirabilaceae bacterium]